MSFKQVIGQEKAIKILTQTVRNSKLPHAYLFSGPRGVGKSLTARQLAKLLNCQLNLVRDYEGSLKHRLISNGSKGNDCCDVCSQCRKIDNFNHPDVRYLEPVEGSRKIKIEQIRGLRQAVNLKPYESSIKIWIILEAGFMTEEASDALLKTLEEPPQGSLLILICSNLSLLLPTIISRCQVIRFEAVDFNRLKEFLSASCGIEGPKTHFLASLSNGSPGRAIGLKEADVFKTRDEIMDWVINGFDGKEPAWLDQPGQDIDQSLDIIISLYRDLLVLHEGDLRFLINLDREKELADLKNRYSVRGLIRIIETINQIKHLIHQNVNCKIALEVMLEELVNV